MSSQGAPRPTGAPPIMPPISSGPPYLPTAAGIGGMPTVDVDVPISAVFLFLFVLGAAAHMTILQVNQRRSHKFIFSGLIFGFCMARIVALVMRIVWATHPTDINVAIAGNVFTAAGVVLLYIVNIVFAHRLIRSYHPAAGWHRLAWIISRFLYFSIAACLIMVVTATVHSFFTLDPDARRIDRDIQLVGSTYLAFLAFLPAPASLIAAAWPHARPEKFGRGRQRSRLILLVFTSTLLAIGAGFRAGVAFDLRPALQPAWFHHKACFYVFNFTIEIIVVYAYAAARVDRRFHVPDGSSSPGDYSAGAVAQPEKPGFVQRVNTEAEVFGEESTADDLDAPAAPPAQTSDRRWENRARMELERERAGEAV